MTSPTMSIICAWCQKDLGRAPCTPARADTVSHGCCDDCLRINFPEDAEAVLAIIAAQQSKKEAA